METPVRQLGELIHRSGESRTMSTGVWRLRRMLDFNTNRIRHSPPELGSGSLCWHLSPLGLGWTQSILVGNTSTPWCTLSWDGIRIKASLWSLYIGSEVWAMVNLGALKLHKNYCPPQISAWFLLFLYCRSIEFRSSALAYRVCLN